MYLAITQFGMAVTGLFSSQYAEAPWSWAKVWDMLKRLWLPVIIIGTAGAAGDIDILFANENELAAPIVDFLHNHPEDRPEDVFGGRNTIHTGASHASFFLVPFIPAAP